MFDIIHSQHEVLYGSHNNITLFNMQSLFKIMYMYVTTRSEVYEQLVAAGLVVPQPERDPPTVPMDYSWAQELGLVRKPAAFMSSICDERGEELLYAGMPISDVFKEDIGIGGVLSLLWFQRRYVH